MGLWTDQVVPRMANRVLDDAAIRPVRARVCSGLSGAVVEIGFGSGLNTPFYPGTVTGVAAVEPSDVAWRLATERVASSPVSIERSGLDGRLLPFAQHSADSALSTLTLCTIPDPAQALAELRRVLRPGGALHFLEHGRAEDPTVRRWQDRLTPLNRRLQGGCHPNRPIDQLLTGAGFTITTLERWYLPSAPRPLAAMYEGVARA
jgi:SAM-dependent methyltransferase